MSRSLREGQWLKIRDLISLHRCFVLLMAFWIAAMSWTTSARAQDDVPENGAEADLLAAIQSAESDGSYYVFFDGPANITLTAPIEIPSSVPFFTIDGSGFNPTISGGNVSNVFIFQIDSGVQFSAIDLTLSDGENTNGGAIYVEQEAELFMTNCVLTGNNAVGTNANPGNPGLSSLQSNGQGGQRATAGSSGLGGAIFNLGSVILLQCSLSNNAARGGFGGSGGAGGDAGGELSKGGSGGSGGAGAIGWGGAICNFGSPPDDGSSDYSVMVSNCVFTGNSAVGGDGGSGGAGGSGFTPGLTGGGGAGGSASGAGIYSTSAICVVNCTFANNTAQAGTSANGGSGPTKGKSGPTGPNSFGGGICLIGQDGMESDITNCTFFENFAIGGTGGAGGVGGVNGGQGGTGGTGTGGSIYFNSVKVPVDDFSSALTVGKKTKAPKVSYINADLVVVNSTFSMGGASGGTNGSGGTGPVTGINGARGHGRGGNIASEAGHFTLMGNIIGTNISGSCGIGKFIDAGYNIVEDRSIAVGKKSHSKVNPELQTLAYNGGPTPTLKLLVPSPATNKIPAELLPATDQRGVPRPASGTLGDIGSFELVTKPEILTQPINTAVLNGNETNFFVAAVGDESAASTRQTLFYQWRLGGTNLSGAIYSSYSGIPNAVPTNQGPYDVIVSNIYGTITSAPAFFLFPPYMVQQPASSQGLTNVGVAAGSNVTISATVAGTTFQGYPSLQYQWQLNGTNLTPPTTYGITIITNNYLPNSSNSVAGNLFNNTIVISTNIFGITNNAGAYTVAITNNYGAVTSTVCSVSVGPNIIVQPQSQTVSIGSPVTFSVVAGGFPPPTYQWFFSPDGTNINQLQGATASTYTISSAQSINQGYYYVVVTVPNNGGSIQSSEAFLSVGASAPIIEIPPASQVFSSNATATFSVTAAGSTSLSYQWLFNGASIAGATSSSLTISNEQTTNVGAYAVLVADSLGTNESATAFLETSPFIITPPTNQTGTIGTNATFSVTAGGGGLGFQWSFNSNAIVNGVITNSITITNGDQTSVLTLTNIQATNLGTYTVLITNLVPVSASTNASLGTNAGQIATRALEASPPLAVSTGSPLPFTAAPPAIAPAQITSVSFTSNLITFLYPGVSGSTYVLEYKSNLDDSDWVPLLTNSPATDGPVLYQDPTTNGSSRYYRIWTQ